MEECMETIMEVVITAAITEVIIPVYMRGRITSPMAEEKEQATCHRGHIIIMQQLPEAHQGEIHIFHLVEILEPGVELHQEFNHFLLIPGEQVPIMSILNRQLIQLAEE